MWWEHNGQYNLGRNFDLLKQGFLEITYKITQGNNQGDQQTIAIELIEKLRQFSAYMHNSIQVVPDADYRKTYGNKAVEEKSFVNIGGGPNWHHPCWQNLDLMLSERDATPWDLFDHAPLPFADNQIEVAYTSHTIEHLDDETVQNLFDEVQRVLKPGGIFRIACPDAASHYRAYKSNEPGYFKFIIPHASPDASLEQLFLLEFAAHASSLNETNQVKKLSDKEIREIFESAPMEEALEQCSSLCTVEVQKAQNGGPHMNWFTESKVQSMLTKAGFEETTPSAYGKSSAYVMRDITFFDYTAPGTSLFVEATKT